MDGNVLRNFIKEHGRKYVQDELDRLSSDGIDFKIPVVDKGEKINPGTKGVRSADELFNYERIIDGSDLLPVSFLIEGAEIQKAVARVKLSSFSSASGFLVSNSLFLTNNHVIPNDDDLSSIKVQFNFQNDKFGNPETIDEYKINPNFFHTNANLDYTLVRLRSKPLLVIRKPWDDWRWNFNHIESILENDCEGRSRGPVLATKTAGSTYGFIPLDDAPSYAEHLHLNIIQHPRGDRKQITVQHNHIDEVYDNVIRYTSDTEPGSSGSPVLKNNWDLVALHHAGGARNGNTWINNEGIRIDRIIEDIRSTFQSTNPSILNELGI